MIIIYLLQYYLHWKIKMKTGLFAVFSYLVLNELAICHKETVLLKTVIWWKTEHYQPSPVIF